MFKCAVEIDEDLQKEANEKVWIISLTSAIIGVVGLISYIILSIFFKSIWLTLLLCVMAFAFGFGIVYMFVINRINKKSVNKESTDELEIFEDYIDLKTIKNGEVIVTLKTYYKDLFRIRETKNFLFLYINRSSALAVPKKVFTPEEYLTIKGWASKYLQKN